MHSVGISVKRHGRSTLLRMAFLPRLTLRGGGVEAPGALPERVDGMTMTRGRGLRWGILRLGLWCIWPSPLWKKLYAIAVCGRSWGAARSGIEK